MALIYVHCIYIIVAETPMNLTAVYKSATSVLLQWTITSKAEDITGYVVYYEHAGESGSHNMSISNGDNTHLLTGLPTGGIQSISLVALSLHLPSGVVEPVDPGML